jgi:hypothetical protein
MKNRPEGFRLRHGRCVHCKVGRTTIREFAAAVAGVSGHIHGIHENCSRCGAIHITVAGKQTPGKR